MNPTVAQPAPSNIMHAVPTPAPVKTELVQNIPVKVPLNHSGHAPHPIAATTAPAHQDKALDVVLKDVTRAVKNPRQAVPQFAPPAKVKKPRTGVAIPITLAVIMASALSAAAYYTFGG